MKAPELNTKEPPPELLDLLAGILLRLSYGEMIILATDLHSDIETHDPKPADVAALLYRWAHRTVCEGGTANWPPPPWPPIDRTANPWWRSDNWRPTSDEGTIPDSELLRRRDKP